MGDEGTELPAFSAETLGLPIEDDAHSDARLAGMGLNPTESHALLARLAMVWPRLRDSDRAAVVEVAERMAIARSEETRSGSSTPQSPEEDR